MNQNQKLDYNLELISAVNSRLLIELESLILSPEAGIQKIRKVLYQFGLDMPALYDASRDGDEVLFDISDYFTDNSDENEIYLYFIYYQTDDGNYEFHSELVSPDKLEDFLDDEDDIDFELDSNESDLNAI